MTRWLPQTLFGRLLLVFLTFGAVMTAALLVVMQVSHRSYHLEADQTVNRRLAQGYVDGNFLLSDAPLTGATLHRGLGKLSAANPDVDIYLVDPSGALVAASVPRADWRRDAIDLAPIDGFLRGAPLPILGDDPREVGRRDIFSAARVSIVDCPAAYLYVVLHRGEHAEGASRLRAIYSISEGAGVMVLAAVLAVVLSLVVVRSLTRRLSVLDDSMRRFEAAGGPPATAPPAAPGDAGDEIDRLTAAFGRLATRVEEQMHALQSTDAMRREVLANVSHDLRTPLTTLRTHLERLAISDVNADERREYVDVALRQCRRLIRLVEQLLEVAKLDAAQVPVHPEPFALTDLAQDVTQKFELAAREHGVRVVLASVPSLPWVVADVALIERVLDNLLENALRHSPRGGQVELALEDAGEHVRVSVTDNGPGLEPESAARVFDRFYRADPSRSGSTGQAGLGLAIVKSILELHATTIRLDGRPGRGARFSFELRKAGVCAPEEAGTAAIPRPAA